MPCVPTDPSALAGCLCTPSLGAGAWGLPVPVHGFAGSQPLAVPAEHIHLGWGRWPLALHLWCATGMAASFDRSGALKEQVRQVTKVGRYKGPHPPWASGPDSHILSQVHPRTCQLQQCHDAITFCWTLVPNPASTFSDVSWSPLYPLGPQLGMGCLFHLETCSYDHQIPLPCQYGGIQGCGCPLNMGDVHPTTVAPAFAN